MGEEEVNPEVDNAVPEVAVPENAEAEEAISEHEVDLNVEINPAQDGQQDNMVEEDDLDELFGEE